MVRKIRHFGFSRYCPVCSSMLGRFLPFGIDYVREDALCPVCGSLERHRLAWLYISGNSDLFDGRQKSMLHIAPEMCLSRRFSRIRGLRYVTAGLNSPPADVQMDITSIGLEDGVFDIIYCSHVLEHIIEDVKAMKELRRVLKPKGWAVLQVPLAERESTFEDVTVQEPDERLRVFGHPDHVRIYGKDFVEKLRNAGFSVDVITTEGRLEPDEKVRFGLATNEESLYLCT